MGEQVGIGDIYISQRQAVGVNICIWAASDMRGALYK
jgi:hypothetical protein